MTRIRSTREIRITPPVVPRTGAAAHTSAMSGTSGTFATSDDAHPDAQRFGALYDAARQRAGNDAGEQTSQDDSPDDHARDQDTQARDKRLHDDACADTACPDAPAVVSTPLPMLPPLPPLHPLSGALAALRKNRRTSAADSHGMARETGGSSTRQKTPNAMGDQDDPHDASPDDQLGIRMIRRCAQAAEGDLLTQHLAEHVAGFCTSPAVKRTGQWEIAVELDPSILPRTELHLSLSGSALTLRFDSRDPRGRQLICDNSNELKTRLEARLGGQIAVDVTVL
ncbi:type III secretion system protein SctP [Paraburkholderia rhynchosiae]|uniref:Type III secretion protein HpaP n=1 Tax=Paraburkholderia rhynchosiae TaxID=487049 RepID=A0A2N7W5Y0_9BURK|nr:type III secretion system protein SctP [Paraburkholderia rhynchosiae]PMS24816.1 hypothetical protein C0Z16_30205 [Paraburkholderia rhynchosiae]CAB3725567.1 hypothetical protein LMG27174_05333 [Paraburkholderia rhynchosiae]